MYLQQAHASVDQQSKGTLNLLGHNINDAYLQTANCKSGKHFTNHFQRARQLPNVCDVRDPQRWRARDSGGGKNQPSRCMVTRHDCEIDAWGIEKQNRRTHHWHKAGTKYEAPHAMAIRIQCHGVLRTSALKISACLSDALVCE